uniref:Uncharacterized protein n=1 Tax=Panagrolaimus sp. PS1159 TaxID=55785 RepID=A0AC35F7T3_9BILA
MTNAVRSKIRHIIEERQNLIFNDSWATISEPINPKEVKDIICAQITAFYEVFKKKIDPLFSDTEKKKKFLEITLCQEYTKAAHASIKNFIKTLQNYHGVIFIECWLNEDRLTVPLRMIMEELKAPIELMLKNDKVKITPEEAEDINEQINSVIEKLLRIDEIYKIPILFQFLNLIKNEQVCLQI